MKGACLACVLLVVLLAPACVRGQTASTSTKNAAAAAHDHPPVAGPTTAEAKRWDGHFIMDNRGNYLMTHWGFAEVDGLGDKLLIRALACYVILHVDLEKKTLRKVGDFRDETSRSGAILAGNGVIKFGWDPNSHIALAKFSYGGRLLGKVVGPALNTANVVDKSGDFAGLSRLGPDRVILSDGERVHEWDADLRPKGSFALPDPPPGHKWVGSVWGGEDGQAIYLWSVTPGNKDSRERSDAILRIRGEVAPFEFYVSRYSLSEKKITGTVSVNNGLETLQYETDPGLTDVQAVNVDAMWNWFKICRIQHHNFVFPDSRHFYQLDLLPVATGDAMETLYIPLLTEFDWASGGSRELDPYLLMQHQGFWSPSMSNIALLGDKPAVVFYNAPNLMSYQMTHDFTLYVAEFPPLSPGVASLWVYDKLEQVGTFKQPVPLWYKDTSLSFPTD